MSDEGRKNPFEGYRIEIDPERIEKVWQTLRDRARGAVAEGRHTRVRLSYKGQPIGPDIPLAVLLAGEGAAVWLISPIGALLVNLGAKAFLDVEFIHASDELVAEGIKFYLDGDTEAAEKCYRDALQRRPDDPSALYNLGVLLRVTGRKEEALAVFRRAAMGPEGHPDVAKASEAADKLAQPRRTL
jgi:tetratricopeptide (TPR) repeat protein